MEEKPVYTIKLWKSEQVVFGAVLYFDMFLFSAG